MLPQHQRSDTHAVEILGEQLNLGRGAVGSILAAVGTTLPGIESGFDKHEEG
jgi:Ca2+/Na+ antiporter